MADRLYVFTSRQIIEAVLRSVPAPPWEEIDSAEFRAAENGGVVTLYLRRPLGEFPPLPQVVRAEPSMVFAGQPISPTTLPLMDVQDDPSECLLDLTLPNEPLMVVDREAFLRDEPGTVKECPDPVHELLKPMGLHTPPDPAVHSIDRYAAQTAESPEALYQTLRLYVDPVEHAPTLAQIRKWSSEEQIAAARWVTVEHAHNSPIAGHELPEREAIPIHVSQAIVERRAELERLRSPELTGTSAKPAKKKRGGK